MVMLGRTIFGKSPKQKQVPTMTPEQQKLLGQLMQFLQPEGGLGAGFGESTDFLRDLMDPSSEAVERFADPYMRQFEQETVPGLAERFAGAGAMGGGLQSSGFGQSLSAAGGNLQSQLAALKSQLGQQAAGQLMGQYGSMLGQGLGARPFGYTYNQGSPGLALPLMQSALGMGGIPGFGF
jgi:hypothetical protein